MRDSRMEPVLRHIRSIPWVLAAVEIDRNGKYSITVDAGQGLVEIIMTRSLYSLHVVGYIPVHVSKGSFDAVMDVLDEKNKSIFEDHTIEWHLDQAPWSRNECFAASFKASAQVFKDGELPIVVSDTLSKVVAYVGESYRSIVLAALSSYDESSESLIDEVERAMNGE